MGIVQLARGVAGFRAHLGADTGDVGGGMEVPEMVRMALSELIQAAVMAEPAAVMVYCGLWRRGHGKEAKQAGVRVGVLLVHAWRC